MLNVLVIALIATSLTLAAALLLCGYLYGTRATAQLLARESRRRERRSTRELTLWQAKLLQRSGLGTLKPSEKAKDDPEFITRRPISPNEAIARARQPEAVKPSPRPRVPVRIAEQFLEATNQGETQS